MRSLTRGVVALAAVLMMSGVGAPALAMPRDAGHAGGLRTSMPAVPSYEYWLGPDIFDIEKAWQVTQGAGVVVAVIDSGVQASTPELQGQVLPGTNITGSGDGRTDVHDDGFPADVPVGHGTDMAAIIAASGAGGGYVGIAPAAKILPVTVAENADNGAIPQAIRWAVDHGANVINISQGGPGQCTTDEQSAVLYAYGRGVPVVVATGNSSSAVSKPANCVGALAVGAVNPDFTPWPQENFGPELDFVAPGSSIPVLRFDGGVYNYAAGTSLSTAMVSGIVALVRSEFPKDSIRQLITRLLWTLHNGLGGGVFAKRISDQLGYGQPLPKFALTVSPGGTTNPISDAVDAYVKAHPASSSPAGPYGSSSSSKAASGGGGGSKVALIVAVVLVVAALIVVLVVVGTRRGRRGASGPPPYVGGGPGYGPPSG